MGWGRYAHSIRVFVLNVGFIYIRWAWERGGRQVPRG